MRVFSTLFFLLSCTSLFGQSVDVPDNKPSTEAIYQTCHHQRNITNSSIKLEWVRSDSIELKRAVESGWIEQMTNYLEKETIERELQVEKHNLRSESGFPDKSLNPVDYEKRVILWADMYCE
jgi:hypothetical protein